MSPFALILTSASCPVIRLCAIVRSLVSWGQLCLDGSFIERGNVNSPGIAMASAMLNFRRSFGVWGCPVAEPLNTSKVLCEKTHKTVSPALRGKLIRVLAVPGMMTGTERISGCSSLVPSL
ncbi:protein containing conotoxin T superfamily domain [Pseudomonas phage EM]|uniref:Protein containing conotoxin T superfamily domain n=1 Tax=Pseudomonas phage EM TaxID=2936914 RepID=A0AAE9KSZ7_9CAUD|nr:protein containing conotoxin T superfamily domain [Pseudomonas phage EM]UPW35884.1 protein containing conotoxin T superfamily domain [Pseudomonas phage EM]